MTLTESAPAAGLTVNLWTSGSPAFVPTVVIVPEGATSMAFPVTTIETTTNRQATITPFYNGVGKTGVVTVTP